MPKYDDQLCRNCTIPSCDESHPQCFYRIWRESEKQNTPAQLERMRQFSRARHAANPAIARQRVAEWQRNNREKLAERQRRYHQRKREAVL